jgi:hypothetical protein
MKQHAQRVRVEHWVGFDALSARDSGSEFKDVVFEDVVFHNSRFEPLTHTSFRYEVPTMTTIMKHHILTESLAAHAHGRMHHLAHQVRIDWRAVAQLNGSVASIRANGTSR